MFFVARTLAPKRKCRCRNQAGLEKGPNCSNPLGFDTVPALVQVYAQAQKACACATQPALLDLLEWAIYLILIP